MRTPVSDVEPAPVDRETLGNDAVGRLARYWFELAAAAGGVPPRSSFDPARVVDLLPRLVVAEHLGGGDFRYRLLGTEVDSFTKSRYTGKRTSEIAGHGPGNRIHAVYLATLASRVPVAMAMPYVGTSRFCQSVRQLSLPFRTADGADQLISLIDFELRPGVVLDQIPELERRLI